MHAHIADGTQGEVVNKLLFKKSEYYSFHSPPRLLSNLRSFLLAKYSNLKELQER